MVECARLTRTAPFWRRVVAESPMAPFMQIPARMKIEVRALRSFALMSKIGQAEELARCVVAGQRGRGWEEGHSAPPMLGTKPSSAPLLGEPRSVLTHPTLHLSVHLPERTPSLPALGRKDLVTPEWFRERTVDGGEPPRATWERAVLDEEEARGQES